MTQSKHPAPPNPHCKNRQLLESATKAAQCSSLLCDDLRAFAITDDLVLHDVVIAELRIAAEQRIRLERLVDHLKNRMAKL